ncbi:cytochrome P450 [Candidatus Poriferisodalis sp.]|uniref:cytochrome P450 n=1 Tax=Candidatus Poriferisodalis sp. TaxID=3101277 RepID=UPI003B024947
MPQRDLSSADTSEAPDVDLEDFGLFDPAIQQCPHAYYAKMQQEAPVFAAATPGAELYLITRYDDVVEVVRDTDTFSSQFDTSSHMSSELAKRMADLYRSEGGYPPVRTMLTADPPAHTRFRRLISKAFTPKVISDLEPTIRDITTGLIDAMLAATADGSSLDFVEAFAVPLPVTVIAKALNVPDDRLADFKRWSDASIAGIGTNISIEERLDAEREVIEFQKYFAHQLENRETSPQDDLLTNLLSARIDRDTDGIYDTEADHLTMAEMLSIIQQLLVAGNETTTKMLTEMMRLLGEHPGEWQHLREDPERARSIIEETLRISTPVQGMFRVVRHDTTVAGVDIPAGARVVAMYSAANRDSSVFDEPESFCPERDGATDHLAFGRGIHYCVGAALARLEGKVALEELARRLSSFELDPANTFEYHPSFMLRGLKRLDVNLTAT